MARVIWGMPWGDGYVTYDSSALESYLDAGGKLFISGQEIGWRMPNSDFLTNYLHASYVQDSSNLYGVLGAAGDPITDGLSLRISGGDGANNQYYPDEIDPIAPAVAVFAYDPTATAPGPKLVSVPVATAPTDTADETSPYSLPTVLPQQRGAADSRKVRIGEATAQGIISSGAAGLRVDTGTYKVVYLSFGFEAISTAADRANLMGKALNWLAPDIMRLAPPVLSSPSDGAVKMAGLVSFAWQAKDGAAGYRFQLDNVDSFNSPALVDVQTQGLEYSANLTLGVYFWRVRASLDQDVTDYSEPRWLTVANPVVQVTSDPASDGSPAMAQASDGKILVAWARNGDIWYKTSSDNGTTWAADTRLTSDPAYEYMPAIDQMSDGRLWVVWYRDYNLWHTTTDDGGVTWSAQTQLVAIPPSKTGGAAIGQDMDGKIWLVWTLNGDILYRTSTDNGNSWSGDSGLVTTPGWDYNPSIAQMSDSKIWLAWERDGSIWYKTSSDNGISWSGDTLLIKSPPGGPTGDYDPSLAQSSDGKIWVAWYSYRSGQSDIWYKTSSDNGTTWSSDTRLTRFIGYDSSPSVAALEDGRVAIAWQSDRAANSDIWFGIPGSLEDVNPPPHLDALNHARYPNPTSSDAVTVTARMSDESGVADHKLVWSVDKVMQPDLAVYDDGTHGDKLAGDNTWTVQIGPFAAGSVVDYQVRVTDIDGNSVLAPTPARNFKSLPPWAAANDILLIVDSTYPSEVNRITPYYKNALDSAGLKYDVWDTNQRGAPDAGELLQYRGGMVTWSIPYTWSYLKSVPPLRSYSDWIPGNTAPLKAYLDAGGKLFITGQNVAEPAPGYDGQFLQNYLHAKYIQGWTGLYSVNGVAGDPISNGLALSISGGDGANNQNSTDEIDPIAPAVPMFTYNPASTALAAAQSMPEAPGAAMPYDQQAMPGYPPAAGPTLSQNVTAQGIISSGAAGLRVDTGTYKLVYLSFGFEAISTAADRANLMSKVFTWLDPGWRLQLMAASGNLSDLQNQAGVSYTASQQYDTRDVPEPPPGVDFVRLHFPHGDWPLNPDDYTTDIRPPANYMVWDFEVVSSVSGNVTLSWDVLPVPPKYTLTVRDTRNTDDPSDDIMIDMRGNSEFVYLAAVNQPRRFQLIAGVKKVVTAPLATGWNLFSLPLDASPNDWAAQVGDDVSPLYLYWYDPIAGGYKMWAADMNAFQPRPGAGYWVKATSPTTLDIEGYPVPDEEFTIHLKRGWNMIGQPFEYAVDWGDALVSYNGSTVSITQAHTSNWVMQYAYGYDPSVGGYSFATAPDGVLAPWRGYWVKSLVDADLIIPNKPYLLPTTLKLTHGYSADSVAGQTAQKFKELVELYTSGLIKVDIYTEGKLYSPPSSWDAVRRGVADVSWDGANYATPVFPNANLLTLWGMWSGPDHQKRMFLSQTWNDKNKSTLATAGIQYLGTIPNFMKVGYVSNNRSVTSDLSEYSGAKIGVYSSSSVSPIDTYAGLVPVVVPSAEMIPAFQHGVTDVLKSSLSAMVLREQWTLPAKYASVIEGGPYGTLGLMNKARFDSLPKEYRDIIMLKVMPQVFDYADSLMRTTEDAYLTTLIANMQSVYVASVADMVEYWAAIKEYDLTKTILAQADPVIVQLINDLR